MTPFNTFLSDTIVEKLRDCLIQEDKNHMSTHKHGLELSVSTSTSRADCFEANVAILSRHACHWIQQTLESIVCGFVKSHKIWLNHEKFFSVILDSVKNPSSGRVAHDTLWDSEYEVVVPPSLELKYRTEDEISFHQLVKNFAEDNQLLWSEQALFFRWDHVTYGMACLNQACLEAICKHLGEDYQIVYPEENGQSNNSDPSTDSTTTVIKVPSVLDKHKGLESFKLSKQEHFLAVWHAVQATNGVISKYMEDKTFPAWCITHWSNKVCCFC
jgi:hypothetical protein